MKWFCLISAFALVLIMQRNSSGEESKGEPKTKLIPLDQIWAYEMPGTRKIGELDAVKDPNGGTAHPIVRQMVLSLASRRPKEGETVGPAFIVPGTGKKALENARAVLTNTDDPAKAFSAETELTLVFYSVIGGGYVHITAVKKSDQVITVKYQFVSHNTRNDSLHFALVPLGQLREGEYEVKIEQIGSVDTKGRPAEPIASFERVVCSGSSFTIREEKP